MKYDEENLRETFGKTLVELGENHPEMLVLDADLDSSTRTHYFKERFPTRFVQCGVAEADLIGIAAGLASTGFVTVPSTFAAFVTRKALDQVFMNVCYPNVDVKIPGCYAGLTAAKCGPSHNVVEDIAIMRSLPNIRVAAPGDSRELRSFMIEMLKLPGPVYFRVEKADAVRLFDDDYQFRWGSASILQDGSDISLFGTGITTGLLLSTAKLLDRKGIKAQVVHFPSIKPIDASTIEICARKTGHILTCENGRALGGFGGAVAEVVVKRYPVSMDFAGIGDETVESASLDSLLRAYSLSPHKLVERAQALLGHLADAHAPA